MAKVKLEPTRDHVVVKREEVSEKTDGGILLPGTVRAGKARRGIVVAAGPGAWNGDKFVEMTVKVGDRVLLGQFAGSEFDIETEHMVIVREEEILVVIR